MNKKGIEKFLEMKDEMREYLKEELEYIENEYGVFDEESKMLMLAFFLYNCHDTISSISCEFTNGRLSKSTYDKSVYLSEIQSTQQEHFETMHFEDIEDYVESEDNTIDRDELMTFLKGYFSSRDTFREDTRK